MTKQTNVFENSKVTMKGLANMMLDVTNQVLGGIADVQIAVAEVKSDVADVKADVAEIKAMLTAKHPVANTVVDTVAPTTPVACPHCGKTLSQLEIKHCLAEGIELSCYNCRKASGKSAQAPKKLTTEEEATTKYKYVGRCTHEFEYTKPTYAKYLKRCRELNKELGMPVILCPACAKAWLDAYNQAAPTQEPTQSEESVNQGF